MEKRNGHLENLLEEFERADQKRRINLWLMLFELRDEFDEDDRYDKNHPRKFGVDPCAVCCGG